MSSPTGQPRAEAEAGFTLVEIIVTLFAGMIVLLGVMMVLDLSLRQSARATDRVEASEHGRTAMEQVVQEIHSSCVWAPTSPVQQNSDASHLYFISQLTSSAVAIPVMHELYFSGGTLYDATFSLTNPNDTVTSDWTYANFSTTATSTRMVAQNVSQASINSAATPYFQYYQYVNGTVDSTSTYAMSTLPLTSTTAPNVGEVKLSFAVGPTDTSTEVYRTINLTDAVVVTPPTSAGGASVCE
jgi:Tfp pilus assembly protein PilW